ncbi:zinc finger, RING-CH-type, zinc finger, RING/FYVE/PHD-type containing protein [Tanacetum coccineum]
MTASSTTTNNNKTDQLVTIPQNNINSKEDGLLDKKIVGDQSCCSKMVMIKECRICQDEDQEHELESPCACNGTLKFAHRKCIQKWCNKKGDITCEICNQVYSPDYTLPPTRINPDVMTIDIRHAWGPQMNLRDAHFLAFASGEHRYNDDDLQSVFVYPSAFISSSNGHRREVE